MTPVAPPPDHAPRRKKILFLRGFQLRFSLLVAGSLTVLLLFTGLHGLFVSERLLPPDLAQQVQPIVASSTWRVFGVGILYVIVVTLAAVFLSHREVGPVARLERELRDIAENDGDIKQLKVRDGDGLESLVDAMNLVVRRERAKKS